MVEHAPGDPSRWGRTVRKPAYDPGLYAQSHGRVVAGGFDGAAAKFSAAAGYFITANGDFMGDFSGQGPTEVDSESSPTSSAPGVNVLSSDPDLVLWWTTVFRLLQGTSMLPAPRGSAAIVAGLSNLERGPDSIASLIPPNKDVLKQATSGSPEP